MARPQVGRLNQPTLTPVAAPGDFFSYRPATGQLGELSRALGNLAPTLEKLAQREMDADAARGKADASAIYAEIKATGQKIKSGEIAPHESKWYRAAAEEQVGRLVASAYGQDLILATQQDETLRDSTDPADFDKFESSFRQDFLGKMTEGAEDRFLTGFNSVAGQSILNARQSFVADAARRLDGQVIDNTYSEYQLAIKDGITAGLTPQEIAQSLSQRLEAMVVANPKIAKSLNQTTIEAVFDAARAYEDPELLKILDAIPGGTKGSTLGMTRAAMSKRDDVEREIRSNRQQRLSAEEKDEKRQRKQAVEAVYDEAFAALEADPSVDVKSFAERLITIDRNEVSKLFRLAKAFQKPAGKEDEGVARGLWGQLFEDDLSDDDILTAFEAGSISIATAKQLRAQLKQNRKGGSSASKAIVQDPVFAMYARDLDGLFIKHMGDVPGARGVFAQQQLRQEWLAYRQSPEGAAASEKDKLDWLQERTYATFLRFADENVSETRSLVRESPKPDRPLSAGGRPTMPNWENELVGPWANGANMDRLEKEYNELRSGQRARLSAWAESFVITYNLKGDDVPLFIQKQRQFGSGRR